MHEMREESLILRARKDRSHDLRNYRSTWSSPPQFFNANSYNIFMDLTTLLLTFIEIALVLYLSIHHFLDAEDKNVEAMAMLLPILLNFIGVMYFLSKSDERYQFETIGCTRCCTDILQFPIFGPVITGFMIFLISCGWSHNMQNYHRLEASASKMRQATTFFSAAPEALVQLTVLLVIKSEHDNSLNKYLEIAVIGVAVIAIAEANTFSLITNYFRIFHEYEPGDWNTTHDVKFWQKCLLFLHALTSVGSRIFASAFVKAAIYYISKSHMFGLVLATALLAEIGYRTLLYYLARLLKHVCINENDIPSGCYESMNYAWRETILSFGFQSQNICVQAWFYIENVTFFICWILSIESTIVKSNPEFDWVGRMTFLPVSIIFCTLTGSSFILLIIIHFSKLFVIRGPFYLRD